MIISHSFGELQHERCKDGRERFRHECAGEEQHVVLGFLTLLETRLLHLRHEALRRRRVQLVGDDSQKRFLRIKTSGTKLTEIYAEIK